MTRFLFYICAHHYLEIKPDPMKCFTVAKLLGLFNIFFFVGVQVFLSTGGVDLGKVLDLSWYGFEDSTSNGQSMVPPADLERLCVIELLVWTTPESSELEQLLVVAVWSTMFKLVKEEDLCREANAELLAISISEGHLDFSRLLSGTVRVTFRSSMSSSSCSITSS